MSFHYFSVWLHLVTVAAWLGGMFFLVFVLMPILRHPEIQPTRTILIAQLGLRFRVFGWVCFAFLFLTGLYNLTALRYGWQGVLNATLWHGKFGRVLMEKLSLFGLVLIVSALHDFWVGPRAIAFLQQSPTAPEALKWRNWAAWLGRINFVLGLLLVAWGLRLVRFQG
ncbi:MAG: DUF4149 domain-containing protein [candidate division WOR-3 bacterium]